MTPFDDSLWDRLMAEHDAHLVALGAPDAERPARRAHAVGVPMATETAVNPATGAPRTP